MNDYTAKLIVIGNSGVGKTHLCSTFCNNESALLYFESTIGVDFMCQTISLENKQKLKIQVWDTAGQERFHSITHSYYLSADAIIVVYDVTDRHSFQKLPFWINETLNHGTNTAKIYIVGTKRDLDMHRQVSEEEGRCFAKSMSYDFFELSSRNDKDVVAMFNFIGNDLYRDPSVFLKCNMRKTVILAQRDTKFRWCNWIKTIFSSS